MASLIIGLKGEVHSDCLPDCTPMASDGLPHHLAGALRNGSDRALAGPQAKAGSQPRWRQDHHQGRQLETPSDDHLKDIQPSGMDLGGKGSQKLLRHPQHQLTMKARLPIGRAHG